MDQIPTNIQGYSPQLDAQLERLCMICGVREAKFHRPTPRCIACRFREVEMWRRFFIGSKWERRANG